MILTLPAIAKTPPVCIGDVIRGKRALQDIGIPEENIYIIFVSAHWHYNPEKDQSQYKAQL